MPLSSLHKNLIDVAGSRGAMLISGEAISSAVLDSLRKAAFGLTGASVDTLHPMVTARFDAISISEPQLISANLVLERGGIYVRVTPNFVLTLSLVYTSDPSYRYAELVFNVSDIRLKVRVEGSDIRFQLEDPKIIASVEDNPTGSRDAAIAASGINGMELLRVEGSFAYGTGTRLVASAIGKLPPLGLRELFPAIDFSNTLELAVVNESLAIIPESMSILEFVGCPQGNAANGIVVSPAPSGQTDNSRDWEFYTKPNPSTLKDPNQSDPFTALHLPRTILDARFGKVAPAVSYRERDNGFIGYDVQITGSIKEIRLSIDEARGALRLKLGFSALGTLIADVDLPSIGRVDLATARIELPENNGQANIEALVRIAVDSSAQLLATTEIEHIDLGKARVVLDLFKNYLSAAGGEAAVAGFLLDAVIGRIIAHNIPPLVSQVIRENLDRNFFVLTRLKGLSQYIDRLPNSPAFSGNLDFALLGSNYVGG